MYNEIKIRKNIESIINSDVSSDEKIKQMESLTEEIKISYFFEGVNHVSREKLKAKKQTTVISYKNVINIKSKQAIGI